MTVFLTWPFAATGATASRTLPDRLADTVNVKDFGAVGDGSNDDTAEIQAAIDAAFGTAGSPHGTGAYLNRPLVIPSGNYKISAPLVFTDVVGGRIIGGGMESCRLAGSTSMITITGCENTHFSGFSTECGGLSTSNGRHGVKIDAGTGGVGLRNVTFSDVGFNSSQYGLRVAPGGTGGVGIYLLQCVMAADDVGVRIEGADCQVTVTGGVCYSSNTGFWVEGGDLNLNMQMANAGGTKLDVLHESTGITTIYGTRSESPRFIRATDGTVVGLGVLHQPTTATASVDCVSPASVKLVSASLGSNSTNGFVTGTGNVFLRNVVFANGAPIYMSSFTGQICECVTHQIFTYAQLPPAAEGLTVNLSNANTNTWGASITSSGANRVSARYNASAWTVVGK